MGGGHRHPPELCWPPGVTPQPWLGPRHGGRRGWASAAPPQPSATGLRFLAPPSLLLLLLLGVPHLRGLGPAASRGAFGDTPSTLGTDSPSWERLGTAAPMGGRSVRLPLGCSSRASTEERPGPAPRGWRGARHTGPCRGGPGAAGLAAVCREEAPIPAVRKRAPSWHGRVAPRMCCSGTETDGAAEPARAVAAAGTGSGVAVFPGPCVITSLCPQTPLSSHPWVPESPVSPHPQVPAVFPCPRIPLSPASPSP